MKCPKLFTTLALLLTLIINIADVALAQPGDFSLDEAHFDWNQLPHQEAISIGNDNLPKLAIFIDPECRYCTLLMEELSPPFSVSVEAYLMPLTDLHPGALDLSKAVWCASNKTDALFSVMLNHNLPLSLYNGIDCDSSGLDRIGEFAKKANFNATPVIINEAGEVHYGFLSMGDLTRFASEGEAHHD